MAKLAEQICMFTKDAFVMRPTKKAPLLLRMALLLFAMVCGIYICSVCAKQVIIHSNITAQEVRVVQTPIDKMTNVSINTYMHYQKPETFSSVKPTKNQLRYFVIISIQRSGTGWFIALLNSHTNISCHGEIFLRWNTRENSSVIIQRLDKVYNLDLFSTSSNQKFSAAIGFKWMLSQGLMEYHKEIVEYLNKRGISVIFLFRRNLLRQRISMLANSYDSYAKILNGIHKAHVHSLEEAHKLSAYKPHIDSRSLITDLKELEEIAHRALGYFNSTRHIILYYEDLVKNHTRVQDVLKFLDLPQMELRSGLVKIHKGKLSEHIKNWDDVKKTLNGTPYEKFLRADNKK